MSTDYLPHPGMPPLIGERAAPCLRWEEDIRRVLVMRLRSIGDTVLATPCLEVLKAWRPALEIDWVSEPISAPVVQGHPLINRLFVLPKHGAGPVVRQMRARRYDLMLNLHGGPTSLRLAQQLLVKRHAMFGHLPFAWLANRRAPQPEAIWGREQVHNVEHQLALLRWLGVPVTVLPAARVVIDPVEDARVAARLDDGPFAVVHVGASRRTKQWPSECFSRIIDELAMRHDLPAVVIATPAERALAETVAAAAKVVPRVCTDLSLGEIMALIRRGRLFLGNDSGPAHLAAACGVPTVALFGSTDTWRWGPWTLAPSCAVTSPAPCGAPYRKQDICRTACSDPPRCMAAITVEMVAEAVDALLAESRPSTGEVTPSQCVGESATRRRLHVPG